MPMEQLFFLFLILGLCGGGGGGGGAEGRGYVLSNQQYINSI